MAWAFGGNKENPLSPFALAALLPFAFASANPVSPPKRSANQLSLFKAVASAWATWIFDNVIMALASTVGGWAGQSRFYWLFSREIYQCLPFHFCFFPEKFGWQILWRKVVFTALTGLPTLSFSRNYKTEALNINVCFWGKLLCGDMIEQNPSEAVMSVMLL